MNNKMGPKIVLCWTAATWTRIFAGLQIIVSIFVFAVTTLGLVQLYQIDMSRAQQEALDAQEALIVLAWVAIVVSVVSFITGVLLGMGVNQSKVVYLDIWTVVTAVLILVSIGVSIAEFQAKGMFGFTRNVVGIGVSAFEIYVVQLLKREIEANEMSGRLVDAPAQNAPFGYQSID